jgi:hypothetical protein
MKASLFSCITILSCWSLFAAHPNGPIRTDANAQSFDGPRRHLIVLTKSARAVAKLWSGAR